MCLKPKASLTVYTVLATSICSARCLKCSGTSVFFSYKYDRWRGSRVCFLNLENLHKIVPQMFFQNCHGVIAGILKPSQVLLCFWYGRLKFFRTRDFWGALYFYSSHTFFYDRKHLRLYSPECSGLTTAHMINNINLKSVPNLPIFILKSMKS